MIAENINGKWVYNEAEINPYKYSYRCLHEGKWYIFENRTQFDEFVNNLIQVNNVIEIYKKQLQDGVQEYLDNIAKSLWYDNIQEATKYINQNIREDWKQESLKLIEYDTQIWTIVEEYIFTLTEENKQDIQIFINNLPKFNG